MIGQISSRVDLCIPTAVSELSEKAKNLEARGIKLHYFMRGEPDFDTPLNICEAAVRSLQERQTHYPPTRGILELRSAISERMQRDFDLFFDPKDEILITTGATEGIYIALQAIIDPGDEVIIFEPTYDPYPTIVRMAGGAPILLPADFTGGRFSIPFDKIEKAITRRTKAILINNPWNPTGSIVDKEDLIKLVEIAVLHHILIICDEIYEKLTYDDRKHYNLSSVSPRAREVSIVINSFSKTYAMTGWRIGYNLASPPLIGAMHRIAQQFSRSAATFIQYAAVEALNGPQDQVQKMVKTYGSRRDLVTSFLQQIPELEVYPPQGTFFYFVGIRSLGMKSKPLSDFLLTKENIVTIPGNFYGPSGEGFLRLSFAYNEANLERGLMAFIKAAKRLRK